MKITKVLVPIHSEDNERLRIYLGPNFLIITESPTSLLAFFILIKGPGMIISY